MLASCFEKHSGAKQWSRRKILADHFKRHLMVGEGKGACSLPVRQVGDTSYRAIRLFAADHFADDRHGRQRHAHTQSKAGLKVAQFGKAGNF